MIPSFTRGEYWLLEAVVEMRVDISCIASGKAALMLNKAAGHGMGRALLIETLMELFHKGLIEVMPNQGRPFPAGERDIVAAIDGGEIVYGLTAEGGRQWELFAAPEWDLYIDVTFPGVHKDEAQYICANRERLNAYLRFSKEALRAVDQSSVRWDIVQPWQATYWKILPAGHRVCFRCDFDLRDDLPFDPWRKMCDMRQWYAWR